MKKLFAIFAALILTLAAWVVFSCCVPTGPRAHTFVDIKPGSSVRQIAGKLESSGVIRNAAIFRLLHYSRGGPALKAGEYLFDHPASMIEAHDRLRRGDVYVIAVVIPEGFNVFDIARALETAGLCTREDFLRAARADTALIADLAPQAPSLEGYLFPDTYNFSRTQTPDEIAATMVRRFRQESSAIGLIENIHRTVTLASFVEKETRIPEERSLIAGVFENRLTRRIGLATDPAVIYASLLIGKYDGSIHRSDLALNSPYNTYRYAGLPPGPIANPGSESLRAAMHPAKTEFLYFVANNQGGHNFARNIAEHNRNVAAYRRRPGQSQ